jgi:hypothetical protein
MDVLLAGGKCGYYHPCDCAMLGALHRAMASNSVEDWYLCRMAGIEATLTHSPKELLGRLNQIHGDTTKIGQTHSKCGPWPQPQSLGEVESLPEVQSFLESNVEHLKAQSAKSGLNPDLFQKVTLKGH